MRTGLQNLKQ